MKIQSARTIVTCPGRNFVTVKLETDEGVYGIGDATLNGRELAVAAMLDEHVLPCLIGKDSANIEDIWQYLYRGVYWRRGAVNMTAIAAVDTALWDIKAKLAGMPLYQLLGGKSREGVLAYCHANGRDISETVDQVARYKELGFKAIRAQTGIPGLDSAYGVSKGKAYYEPADADLPSEHTWSTERYLNHIPKLFEALRVEFGEDLHLLHDAHHRLTPIEAGRLGKALEPFHLYWLEDPVAAENQAAFRLIREHTTTPLAVGEVFNSIWDCKELIEQQLIDYIRTTVAHAGGITHLKRIFDFASLYNVRSGSHGASDLSPVCMGAALHLDSSIPNFGIQEYMYHTEQTHEVFPHAWTYEDGYLHPGEAIGHGVDINEELAAAYPYKRAYLPVNRLEDGSMCNW